MVKTPFTARQFASLPARNLVINGNLDIWQRDAIFNSVSNGAYTADRWQMSQATPAVYNVTRSTDVPTFAQSGFKSEYSLKIEVASGATTPSGANILRWTHKIEGFDYANIHGKPFSLQFWCKSSVAGIYSVSFQNNNRDRIYTTGVTVNSANTWEKKTVKLTGDSTGTWLFNNLAGLQIEFVLSAATAYNTPTPNAWVTGAFGTHTSVTGQANLMATNGNTFFLSQVMVLPGDFATTIDLPFARAGRNIADELSMCQRYFERFNVDTGTYTAVGGASSTTVASAVFYFKTEKRGTPILNTGDNPTGAWSWFSPGGASNVITTTPVLSHARAMSATVSGTTAGGLTTGQVFFLGGAGNGRWLGFDAEL